MRPIPIPPPERLAYVYPISSFIIYFPFVLLVLAVYVAVIRTSEEQYWLVTPEYLTRLEAQSIQASRQGEWYATPLTILAMLVFLFEQRLSSLGQLLSIVFFRKDFLKFACQSVFFFNLFEVGTCVRLCGKCRATPLTMIRYVAGCIVGGYTQRVALVEEGAAFMKRERRRLQRIEDEKKRVAAAESKKAK